VLDIAKRDLSDGAVGSLGHELEVEYPDDATVYEIQQQLEAFTCYMPAGVFASGGYRPEAIIVLSVHDAVPTRICPISAPQEKR